MSQKITLGSEAMVAAAEREIETLPVADAIKLHGADDVEEYAASVWRVNGLEFKVDFHGCVAEVDAAYPEVTVTLILKEIHVIR